MYTHHAWSCVFSAVKLLTSQVCPINEPIIRGQSCRQPAASLMHGCCHATAKQSTRPTGLQLEEPRRCHIKTGHDFSFPFLANPLTTGVSVYGSLLAGA